MKLNSRLILFLSFICFCQITKAQNGNTPNSYLTNYVTPAPNAASLGKYADYPVSYFTGVPQISIPIYNLKDGGINLPISLSYHASGIRVSELASWVGLGWALNAGGVIIRTVRGGPDEGLGNGAGVGPKGYYSDHGLSTLPLLPYPVNGQSSDPGNIFYGQTTPAIMAGQQDCEPDLYTFNFNGHVGKFVFDENQKVRTLEDDNLIINVNFSHSSVNHSTTGSFASWTITTPDGIKYYFGEKNSYEQTFPNSTASGSDIYNGYAPSSWYLTRIVNPNTKDTATFNYVPETYAYKDLGPESTYYTNGSPCDNSSINGGTLNWGIHDLITTNIYGLRLTSIVTKNYTINFVAKNSRADLLNSTNAFSLDSIKINSNQNNTCFKQFALGHTYFTSSTSTGTSITNTLNYYGTANADVTDTKRLKLVTVQEYSGDGTLNKPPYQLTYQESYPNYTGFQLPRRLSYDQDHWGFSNNAPGSRNNFFTPPVFNQSACGTGGGTGAYRHPAWPDMLAYTLTGIQNPLGVATTFTYGPNSAANGMDPDVNQMVSDTLVGGLKILQIKTQDNVTNNTQVRSFSYGTPGSTSGNLFNIPKYLFQLNNEYYSEQLATGGLEIQNAGYVGGLGFINVGVLLKQSQGIVPMQDEQGNYVTYQYVKETFGPAGQGGYKQYQFSNYLSPMDISSRLDIAKYTASGSMSGYPGIYGSGHFNDISPQSLAMDYAGYTQTANCYPFTPQQVDLTGGRLLEEDTYDSANNLLESITNSYSTTYHENYQIRGLKVYNFLQPSTPIPTGLNALSFYKLHTGVSHLTSTIKKTYKGTSYVTETSSFGYESPYHTMRTSDTSINSNGDILINKNYYSFDYTDAGSTNVMAKMLARNLLELVSSYSWKNNALIDGKITGYNDFATNSKDTLINPAGIYALETASPLTPAQANLSQTWATPQVNILPNTYFTPKVNFNYDGATAKPVNEQLTSGINISYQWGYNNTYPVVKVLNAANSVDVTDYATTGSSVTTLPRGSAQTYTVPFTIVNSGAVTTQIGFSGNPGTNPMAEISYALTGPNGAITGLPYLCVSVGSGNCGSYTSSNTINNLPPGQYTLSAYYVAAQNLISDINLTVSYPSMGVTTAGSKEYYYEGFEDNTTAATGTGHTGVKYYNGASYTVNWTAPNARNYVISYWYLKNGGWLYQSELPYTGTSLVLSATGATAYDDIRIHPSDAQMSTYTYDATGNMTSTTDAKSETTYYEYDSLYRLINIRDKDGNIVKHTDYHYHQ